MFSKLLTLAFVFALMGVAPVLADEGSQVSKTDDFHKDSDFMRGFETGLFLRTKNGKVEEYGCEVPTEANNSVKAAFEQIKTSINMAKSKLKMDPLIDQGLNMVLDFLGGLQYFMAILQPKSGQQMDKYCQGMIFGLEGSKLLVKVANTLINPIGKDGKAQGTFNKK